MKKYRDFTVSEVEDMIPWERKAYMIIINQELEAKKQQAQWNKQQMRKR